MFVNESYQNPKTMENKQQEFVAIKNITTGHLLNVIDDKSSCEKFISIICTDPDENHDNYKIIDVYVSEKALTFDPENGELIDKRLLVQREFEKILKERDELKAENERLNNDLADMLDIKNGKGPTALSKVLGELSELREAVKRYGVLMREKSKYSYNAFCDIEALIAKK
jgi:hypothetical protein